MNKKMNHSKRHRIYIPYLKIRINFTWVQYHIPRIRLIIQYLFQATGIQGRAINPGHIFRLIPIPCTFLITNPNLTPWTVTSIKTKLTPVSIFYSLTAIRNNKKISAFTLIPCELSIFFAIFYIFLSP